ncbi:MAG: hypothetical protein FWF79_04760, partial [Defluviitaleaceae bacterium]|nr:hypothetical protein [Defluviitaleaceae bacterium]
HSEPQANVSRAQLANRLQGIGGALFPTLDSRLIGGGKVKDFIPIGATLEKQGFVISGKIKNENFKLFYSNGGYAPKPPRYSGQSPLPLRRLWRRKNAANAAFLWEIKPEIKLFSRAGHFSSFPGIITAIANT